MTKQRHGNPARHLPEDLRARYEEEWRCDLDEATALGVDPRSLRRAMRRTALQLRCRRILDTLMGSRGALRSLGWWALLVVACGLTLPPLLAPLVLAGLLAGIATAPRHRLGLLLAFVVWLACVVYGAAAFSVGFDAADAGLEQPAWTRWWLVAQGLGVLALAGNVVAQLVCHAPDREIAVS